jgi:LL-diaminopimelate aminotransferase
MHQKISVMKAEGRDVINLGLGDPDVVPAEHQLKALIDAVSLPDNHHYPSAYPIKPFYSAICDWYKQTHNVDLDPETELIYCMGGAEGLFQVCNCLLNPGDTVLIPDPGYPSYEACVVIAGGIVERFPLLEQNNFLPDLDSISSSSGKKAKMIWINYPNNPTGATADKDFFLRLIKWARSTDTWIISDNPYIDVYFGDSKPPSFLSLPGAKEVGIEIGSVSKSFNSCGWRVGMMMGNQDVIAGVKKIKSQVDRGIYYPLQVAVTAALTGPVDWMVKRNNMFKERRDVVVRAWEKMGLKMLVPEATFYCWGKIPEGNISREFCLKLLEEKNVWMIPGSTYGKNGEGYVRISNAQPAERIQEAMERIASFI